jgi:hypothetical protein
VERSRAQVELAAGCLPPRLLDAPLLFAQHCGLAIGGWADRTRAPMVSLGWSLVGQLVRAGCKNAGKYPASTGHVGPARLGPAALTRPRILTPRCDPNPRLSTTCHSQTRDTYVVPRSGSSGWFLRLRQPYCSSYCMPVYSS